MFEDNWEVFDAFMSVRTQWKFGVFPIGSSVMSKPVGLDILAVKEVLNVYGKTLTPELLSGLQLIESAILKDTAK